MSKWKCLPSIQELTVAGQWHSVEVKMSADSRRTVACRHNKWNNSMSTGRTAHWKVLDLWDVSRDWVLLFFSWQKAWARLLRYEVKQEFNLWLPLVLFCEAGIESLMGPVRIRHSSHSLGWQPSHSVDLTGLQDKMATIEIPWRNAHTPHCHFNTVTGTIPPKKQKKNV